MANSVACLRCGHRFAPQTDVRKKNNPCPRCGSTEQVELVGVPAPEPEVEMLPPKPLSKPSKPEPSIDVGGGGRAEVREPEPLDSDGSGEGRAEFVDRDDLSGMEDFGPGDRDSGRSGQPLVAMAVMLLLLAVVGYFAWGFLRSDDKVASDTPAGESAAPAAAEPTQTESAEPRPAAPVEPVAPVPMPADAAGPQDPFLNLPRQAEDEPPLGMPNPPAASVGPEPTLPGDTAQPPPFGSSDLSGPSMPEPTMPEPAIPGPTTAEPAIAMPDPAAATTTPVPALPEPALPAEPTPAEPQMPVTPPSSEPTPTPEPVATTEPPAEPPPAVEPSEPATVAAKTAHSLQEAQAAIVKFELPLGIGDLSQSGAGFLIDPRGWVVTNNHVAAYITTDARAKMADGQQFEIEGILATAPTHDLALVKLANPPNNPTILDIQYKGTPDLGEPVYAFGHPYQADFSLSNGVVSRVLTTDETVASARDLLLKKIKAPLDMVWIQHDAKISPGNSGGPLIDRQAHVLGVNTFVNLKAEFGYASHVRYVRELVAGASGQVTPPPPPREFIRTTVSGERIRSAFAACDAFSWRPQTSEQYDQLAELAKQLTLAKHALAVAAQRPGTPSAALQGVASLADQAFAAIQKAPWGAEQLSAFNQFAPDQIAEAGQGVVLYGVVWAIPEKRNVVVMAMPGTDEPALVRLASPATNLEPGSRWLVFGFVTPATARVNIKGQTEPRLVHIVLAHYMTRVK